MRVASKPQGRRSLKFNISQPAVSHHLALLRHRGIVECRRHGKNSLYSLTDTGYRLSKIVKGMVH